MRTCTSISTRNAHENISYLDLVQLGVNLGLVLDKDGPEELCVNQFGASELWERQKEDTSELESEIERHPVQDDVREELNEIEESKDTPISEPVSTF